MAVPLRLLGTQELQVSAFGYGCMGLSFGYQPLPSEEQCIDLIKHAYDQGVTFFDTSDSYGPFTNEVLVGKALNFLPREKIQLATQFGCVHENGGVVVKGEKDYVRKACEDSLNRLDVDYIDLYYQHRIDTSVPIEETVSEMKKLVEEEKVKYIGVYLRQALVLSRGLMQFILSVLYR